MSGNNGGPWGGSGGGSGKESGDDRPGDRNNGGNRPGSDGPQIPEIDELVNKGREQLRVLMGGGGNNDRPNGAGGAGGPGVNGRLMGLLVAGVAVVAWGLSSFYSVRTEDRSVELFLGKYSQTGMPGLNFAPWPFVSYEIVPVTTEQVETIGQGATAGLMLTGDENIVDMDFQVVWNVTNPSQFLFNLRDPGPTINAVAESAMREIVAQNELAPILNVGRETLGTQLQDLLQATLDGYESGINIVRVNIDRAQVPDTSVRTNAPRSPRAAFLEVQAAEQTRDRLEKEADAYANRALAGARGSAAQMLEVAEGYRAEQVNAAEGEASRFTAVLEEYLKAPEVTRRRLYLETMEQVLGDVDKIILDGGSGGGQGVVPYLPLNELRRNSGGNN